MPKQKNEVSDPVHLYNVELSRMKAEIVSGA